METVEKAILTARQENSEESGIPAETVELLEDIAYMMAKHADPEVPDTVEEWLEQFEVLSIYSIIPIIPDLWYANMKTNIKAKKKSDPQTGK
jgi:flavorubredoxin